MLDLRNRTFCYVLLTQYIVYRYTGQEERRVFCENTKRLAGFTKKYSFFVKMIIERYTAILIGYHL